MRWMTSFPKGPREVRANRERGATSVTVGLLMVGLVGFTGLAVDGGGTYAKHQELQNGADAAALAAAHECAEDEDNCDPATLEAEVGSYGEANVRNDKETVDTTFEVNLSEQTVTATVTGTKFHWFMPVLGVSESELSPYAIATWGSPFSGPAMLPLTISLCEFEGEEGEPELGETLDIYMPKNGQEAECSWGSDYPPGGFGWLTEDGCEADVTVGEWVDGDTGADEPKDCDWKSFIGETALIPIFDSYDPEGGSQGQGSQGEYRIDRFAAMEIVAIHPSNSSSLQDHYGDPERCQNRPDSVTYFKTCISGIFKEYVSTADEYDSDPDGPQTEVNIVRLIE